MLSDVWWKQLNCPQCRTRLHHTAASLNCPQCTEVYPVLHNTPIVVSGTKVNRVKEAPDRAAIESIMSAIYLPETRRTNVEDCFRLRFDFANQIFQTESEQFLNRLRSSGLTILDPYPRYPASEIENKESKSSNVSASVQIDVLTWPRKVLVEEDFSVTILLRNTGRTVISECSDTPFRLSSSWEGLVPEGPRTMLLLDVEPGRQMSMAVALRAPSTPGSHKLTILPVIENSHWLPQFGCSAVVEVHTQETDTQVNWEFTHTPKGYNEDHSMAKDRLESWINQLDLNRPARILEIGGNFNPMIQYFKSDAERYNLDIDPFGLMCLSIRDGVSQYVVRNIVADGTAMPFEDGYFDAIVMFATFHHFPNPVKLMRAVGQKLHPEGFVALLCEPVGHVFAGSVPPEFLAELKKGVYEQTFQPWEYREMLLAAGYEILTASVDYGSLKLKARLTRPAAPELANAKNP